jgi:N-acetylglucosamine-6-sulfatase
LRGHLAIVLLALAAIGLPGCGGDSTTGSEDPDPTTGNPEAPVSGEPQPQPNIIVLQVDDQTLAQLSPRLMPATTRLFATHGTTFTNYTASTPQCCPSRVGLITGAYAHNTGVTSNGDLDDFVDPEAIMPAFLQDAGYLTAHIGKYLINYRDDPSVPEGWTEWYTRIAADRSPYYDYDVAVNGDLVHEGTEPDNYSTRVFTGHAKDVISEQMGEQPLYLQLDYSTPHSAPETNVPARLGGTLCHRAPVPDPRDLNLLRGQEAPRPPSFDEQDVSDKPAFIRSLPRVDADLSDRIARRWGCTAAALKGVDRSVRQIHHSVKEAGGLSKTIFVYTSDNGYFFGEHRLDVGKVVPYEEAIHLPLLMRVPPRYLDRPAPKQLNAPVQNIDLAPSFVEWAGACSDPDSCRVMDGRSLVGLLGGHRQGFRHRPVLIEYDQAPQDKHGVCAYAAVRTRTQLYAHYTRLVDPRTGKCSPSQVREHYDLRRDPHELQNLFPAPRGSAPAARERRLERILTRLQDCAGVAGRDPEPASGHYCGQ